jgi:5-methyltetrahydrofolate--homocysteine methyltransferase
VVDIGIDAPGERFIQAAKENGAQIIGLSSLLSTTMPYMKNVMDSVRGSDIAGSVKVMVGGAPVTQSFADEIGAHGYAPDAASAVDVVRTLLGQ